VVLAVRPLAGTAGSVHHADIDQLVPEAGSVDLVTARLSLHYATDIDRVIESATQALAPGGRLIFTVVHPVITSHDNRPNGPRTTWTVDDYFQPGPRPRTWMGSRVTWQHRTIENYVAAVTRAGLTVTSLRECEPDPTRFGGDAGELARRRRVPLFLLINAHA
jgi:SAM-dependent methyltransferase